MGKMFACGVESQTHSYFLGCAVVVAASDEKNTAI